MSTLKNKKGTSSKNLLKIKCVNNFEYKSVTADGLKGEVIQIKIILYFP